MCLKDRSLKLEEEALMTRAHTAHGNITSIWYYFVKLKKIISNVL